MIWLATYLEGILTDGIVVGLGYPITWMQDIRISLGILDS